MAWAAAAAILLLLIDSEGVRADEEVGLGSVLVIGSEQGGGQPTVAATRACMQPVSASKYFRQHEISLWHLIDQPSGQGLCCWAKYRAVVLQLEGSPLL